MTALSCHTSWNKGVPITAIPGSNQTVIVIELPLREWRTAQEATGQTSVQQDQPLFIDEGDADIPGFGPLERRRVRRWLARQPLPYISCVLALYNPYTVPVRDNRFFNLEDIA